MYDLLTAIAVICVCAGIGLVRAAPFHQRVWIGLGLAAFSYGSAMIGLFLVRAGIDFQLLRYAWAGSFGVAAIAATIFLVPSARDWLIARWRHGRLEGACAP